MKKENLFYNENCLKLAVTSQQEKDHPANQAPSELGQLHVLTEEVEPGGLSKNYLKCPCTQLQF